MVGNKSNEWNSESVLRLSTDAGETFGPLMMLATNGTITSTEEEEGGQGLHHIPLQHIALSVSDH
jgi:hypothetical protein